MADQPFHRSSDLGILCSPVATNLPAGVRSLISKLHGHFPPRLGRWAILVRLAVSVVCFTGGSVCAWTLAKCLLDPGACPCLMPPLPSLPVLDLALVPVFAALILTPAYTAPRWNRFRRAERCAAMADIAFTHARAVIDGGVDSHDRDEAETS